MSDSMRRYSVRDGDGRVLHEEKAFFPEVALCAAVNRQGVTLTHARENNWHVVLADVGGDR